MNSANPEPSTHEPHADFHNLNGLKQVDRNLHVKMNFGPQRGQMTAGKWMFQHVEYMTQIFLTHELLIKKR